MIFKCKNCGGNVVYHPEKHKMVCPFCEGEETQEKVTENQSLQTCINCGGELHINDYTSASKCPYCDNYIIFDERVEGDYKPHLVIPFVYGKENTKKLVRDKFKACIFAPDDFLTDARLDSIAGMYVPFWLYDYHVDCSYDGEGTKVRSWTSGDTRYTETSVFHLVREMSMEFDKVPADASDAMPDVTMDLMEPFDYQALEQFKEEYMSGFFAERYNQVAAALEPRTRQKSFEDAKNLLRGTLGGYSSLKGNSENIDITTSETSYALLPVWIYNYKFKNQDYRFYINGQTGKVVGKVPLSMQKLWAYSATVFTAVLGGGFLLAQLVSAIW